MNTIEEKARQIIDVSIPITFRDGNRWDKNNFKELEITKIIVLKYKPTISSNPIEIKKRINQDAHISCLDNIYLSNLKENKCILVIGGVKHYYLTMDYKNIIVYTSYEETESIRKIITIDEIKTRLNTKYREEFIYFKEFIKDVLTEITDAVLYEMLFYGDISFGDKQTFLYLERYGYKKYCDDFDPHLAKAFELVKLQNDDPEMWVFRDLVKIVYLNELAKKISLEKVKDLFINLF